MKMRPILWMLAWLAMGMMTSCNWMKPNEPVEEDTSDQMTVGGYSYADLTSRVMDESELMKLNSEELRFLRNEFYARRGLTFKSPELVAMYGSTSWYRPIYENSKAGFVTDNLFTPAERLNVVKIRCLERRMNFVNYLRRRSKQDIVHMVADQGAWAFGETRLNKSDAAELLLNMVGNLSGLGLENWQTYGDGWEMRIPASDGYGYGYVVVHLDSEGAVNSMDLSW